jgi:hypothetical protein
MSNNADVTGGNIHKFFSYFPFRPKVVWKRSLCSDKTAHCTFIVMVFVKCILYFCNVVCTIKNLSIYLILVSNTADEKCDSFFIIERALD